MQVTQPGGQLWNHEYKSDFQKIEKSDFKKVEKSDLKKVEKYKSFSIEIWQSERADLIDMCIDSIQVINFVQRRFKLVNASGAIWWPNLQPIQVMAQWTQTVESKTDTTWSRR